MATSRSFGGTLLTIRSPMRISPPVMFSSPAIIRSSVDLPQPDGPTSTTKFAIADRDVDTMDHGCRTESLSYVTDCDGSHSLLPKLLRRFCAVFSSFWRHSRGCPRSDSRARQIIGLSPVEKQARLAVGWDAADSAG